MTTTADVRVDRQPGKEGTRIASYLLVEYLERLGVEVVFGLCGHTVIALLDALEKSRIRFITARHEQVAAHAADGYARASGKPGVLLTHLGPGLTNAATGVANAALDSIPMVVIAGDVPSHYHGRHPHQEINLHQDADQFQIFRPFCKRVYRVDRPEDLPRAIERAFHLATSGRPGPVLVDVPMDIFSADLGLDAFHQAPAAIARPALGPATVARIVDALVEAERPLIYAGGGVLSAGATGELRELAEALEIPVAHSLMAKGCMREDHPLLLGMTGFWGTPIGNEKCRTADLILAVGTRLAEANSSSWDPRYTFAIPPTRLIHIDVDPAEIGRNFPTELGAVADAKLALDALSAAARGRPQAGRLARRRSRRRAGPSPPTGATSGAPTSIPPPGAHPERAPEGESRRRFIVTDVGWNKNGVGQQFPITVPGTFITRAGSPPWRPSAVLGVKLAQPQRAPSPSSATGPRANPSVVATAMEAGLPVVWVVMDNARGSAPSPASSPCTTARRTDACSSATARPTGSTSRPWPERWERRAA